MDDNSMNELLQKLHDEINNIQAVDEKGSKLLRDIEGDINALLKRSGETPEPAQPLLVERLENAVRHFEVDHPELTTAISRVLESLSNAGI
jgi:hypothetical protein